MKLNKENLSVRALNVLKDLKINNAEDFLLHPNLFNKEKVGVGVRTIKWERLMEELRQDNFVVVQFLERLDLLQTRIDTLEGIYLDY